MREDTKIGIGILCIVIFLGGLLMSCVILGIQGGRMPNIFDESYYDEVDVYQERLQDEKELIEYHQKLQEMKRYSKNHLICYHDGELSIVSSANGEVQIKVDHIPGVYVENDSLIVTCNSTLVTSHDKDELDVRQIDDFIWRFNVSVGDSSRHLLNFTGGTQSQYVLYVTIEMNPLDGCYFIPFQKEFCIDQTGRRFPFFEVISVSAGLLHEPLVNFNTTITVHDDL